MGEVRLCLYVRTLEAILILNNTLKTETDKLMISLAMSIVCLFVFYFTRIFIEIKLFSNWELKVGAHSTAKS